MSFRPWDKNKINTSIAQRFVFYLLINHPLFPALYLCLHPSLRISVPLYTYFLSYILSITSTTTTITVTCRCAFPARLDEILAVTKGVRSTYTYKGVTTKEPYMIDGQMVWEASLIINPLLPHQPYNNPTLVLVHPSFVDHSHPETYTFLE